MKLIAKYTILVCAFVCISLQSCTVDFKDINTNPNDIIVGSIQAQHLMEPILYGASNRWMEYTWFWNSEMIQYTTFSGTTRNEHRYNISDVNWQTWYRFLAQYAANSNHMRELAEEDVIDALYALGTTLEAFYISNMTDIFGDIPLTEAYQREGNKTPKYETQEEIYRALFEMLEEANAIYAEDPAWTADYVERDGIYGGSNASWRKFNNSLYLRFLMRVSGRTSMNVGAKITEILNDPDKYPVFDGNEDNAVVRFQASAPYQSYFYAQNMTDASFRERKFTEQMIKMTVLSDGGGNEVVDPRFLIWAVQKNDAWKGVISGSSGETLNTSQANATEQNPRVFVWAECPYMYMDYAEVLFIYAEAALKGLIPGGRAVAKQYYDQALAASIEKWQAWGAASPANKTIPDADVDAFLALPEVTFDISASQADLEQLLGDQKYLALYWVGMEAWHEVRRTGYPVLTIGPDVSNENTLPTRFGYPASVSNNNPNCVEVINRNGGNNMRIPVWWSKQAIGS